jgi:hypothetical protein
VARSRDRQQSAGHRPPGQVLHGDLRLAFSLPVIAAGIAIGHIGLQDTALVYGLAVTALGLLAAASLITSVRHAPAAASRAPATASPVLAGGRGPLPPGEQCP